MSDDLTMDSGALIFATLADVYLSSGMIDEAISILQDGLSRNPTYSLAKVILGRAYYIKGDIEESLKVLEGNYEELKDSENTNLYIGHCYKKLGEFEKAVEYYNITLKINPENKDANQELKVLVREPKQVVTEKIEEVAEPVAKDEEEVVEESAVTATVDQAAVEIAPPLGTQEVVEVQSELLVEELEKVAAEPKSPPAKEIPEPGAEEKFEPTSEPVAKEEVQKAPEPAEAVQEIEQPVVQEKKEEEVISEPPAVKEAVAQEREKVGVEEPPVDTFPLETLEQPIKRLLNMKAVKGAFICSKDGLLIRNYYEECRDIELISAMIAAIHNEAEDSFKFLKDGSIEKFIIDKIEYPICVITAGESLLAVVTQPEAKPGLVFVYARKIIEEIREILG
jgi:predicted regulator of Ras-like GTPase activity (Roadblock/LC7/MglB family)/Flp pilus assembly protein TadD